MKSPGVCNHILFLHADIELFSFPQCCSETEGASMEESYLIFFSERSDVEAQKKERAASLKLFCFSGERKYWRSFSLL